MQLIVNTTRIDQQKVGNIVRTLGVYMSLAIDWEV
jgi:hypothetical protein